jgi:hypothetical protein
MVPYPKTLYGRLAEKLEGRFRVYSFGASGAPLSQYLIWASYAVHKYGARAAVINVVGNDFDESHVAYKAGPWVLGLCPWVGWKSATPFDRVLSWLAEAHRLP